MGAPRLYEHNIQLEVLSRTSDCISKSLSRVTAVNAEYIRVNISVSTFAFALISSDPVLKTPRLNAQHQQLDQ